MDARIPPRGDRRAANRRQRREAILDVAFRSFAEHGYGGTTMSQVAARLGGSKATLWSYFPSKEALFAAVVDRATHDFRKSSTGLLNPKDDHVAALREFCDRFLARVASSEAIALHRMVIGETGRLPELGRIFYERAQQRTHRQLAEYIGQLQRHGLVGEAPPLVAARHLIGLCLAGAYQLVLTGNQSQLADEARHDEVAAALKAFLAAYAVAGEPRPDG